MKFKFVFVFITFLACFSNVAFASYIQKWDSSDTISTRLTREVISIDEHEQRNKCYEEYTLKTDDFLAQVKRRSLDCDHVAESAKSQFDVLNKKARGVFQSLVADKMKSTPADNLQKCSEKTSAAEYFQCVRSFETSQREFLDEINDKSRDYFYELEKIEENRRHCLKQVVDENKSNSATLSLQRCLDQIIEPNITPTTSSTRMPHHSNEMNDNLTKLINIYYEVKNCTKNGEEEYRFNDCLHRTGYDMRLKNYLSEHSTEYFPRLNELDKSEDICLRLLVVQFISESRYDGLIFDCFEKGRANSSYYEEINDDKIKQLEMLSKSLNDCKYVDSSETKECVDEALSGMEFEYFSILDENIEKAIASIDVEENDRNCLRFVLKKFQFNGLFLKNSDKKGFKQCFYN